MDKKILFFSVLLLISIKGFSQNSIEGVWSILKNPSMNGSVSRNLSWGTRDVSRNADLIIDLHSDIPNIEIIQFSQNEIINIKENENVVEITFYFSRGNFNVIMICHFNDDGTMWIEHLKDGLTFFRTGEDQIYYKIDEP